LLTGKRSEPTAGRWEPYDGRLSRTVLREPGAVMSPATHLEDPQLDARYPNRTHFVDAQNPHQALMTSRALFSGDPVVVVYPDGREVLFTPEPAHGLVAAPRP